MKRTLGLYVAWLVAAVMIVAATGEHPYSFYILLRWVCCAVFVYSAFTVHEKNRVAWSWIFGALAVPVDRHQLAYNRSNVGVETYGLVIYRKTELPKEVQKRFHYNPQQAVQD